MTKEITVGDIEQACKRIQPYVVKTPVEYSNLLSKQTNCNVYLKLENFQYSGSFKPRGSFNKILSYIEQNGKKPEMIAPTAGGHGVGLSYAADKLRVKANIYMPESADPDRKKIIRQYNASVRLFKNVSEARVSALKDAKENSQVFLSAYNDRAMIEAGGTVGLEVQEQLPDLDCLVLGVSGGGLLSGMAIALKQRNPDLKIVAVQQENNDFLARWHRTGLYPINYVESPTLAEGIGGIIEEECITVPYIKKFVDEYIVVTEQEIKEAVLWVLQEHKHYVEPSAAVGIAAIRKTNWENQKVKNILTVLTGRNMSLSRYKEHILDCYATKNFSNTDPVFR
jgi:threonine dehydratase